MRTLLILAGASALLLAACGGDSSPRNGGGGNGGSASGGGSDEDYLRVICAGSVEFSNALVRETTVEGIARTIEEFIANLKEADPPADLTGFHQELLDYLETSLDDPTSLAVKPRPQPPEEARERLAAKEDDLPECDEVGYFTPPAD